MNHFLKKMSAGLLIACLLFTAVPVSAAEPDFDGAGVIAIDYDSGEILYEKDINTERPVASLTKIMTAFIIYEGVRDGLWNWDTEVPISKENRQYAAADPCGRNIILNETESLRDLTDLTLIISSNACARILGEFVAGSEAAFVQMMNQRAKDLGITARYGDAAGLKWNAVTPKANATLVRTFIKEFPEVLNVTCHGKKELNGKTFYSVNLFYSRVPSPGVDGFKSGWMPFSGFCFAGTAERDGRRVITTLLNCPQYEKSYTETRRLINYAFTRLSVLGGGDEVMTTPLAGEQVTPEKPAETASLVEPAKAATTEDTSTVAVETEKTTELDQKNKPTVTEQPVVAPADYPTSRWAQADIDKAIARGLSCQEERGANTFGGIEPVTRAEFVAILMKAVAADVEPVDAHTFQDIPADAWYKEAVETARALGITHGVSEDEFAPDKHITREQMAALMVNALDLKASGEPTTFIDANVISHDMVESVAIVSSLRLMNGNPDGSFAPLQKATREQATLIVLRLLNRIDDGLYENPLAAENELAKDTTVDQNGAESATTDDETDVDMNEKNEQESIEEASTPVRDDADDSDDEMEQTA